MNSEGTTGKTLLPEPSLDASELEVFSAQCKQRGRHEIECDRCRESESSNDSDRERALHLAPSSDCERERQQADERAQCRHQNWTQPDARGFLKRDLECETGFEHPTPGEIEESDSVLHDEPDEENEPHEARHIQRRSCQ